MPSRSELVERRYRDALGKMRDVPGHTLRRIDALLAQHAVESRPATQVIRQGQRIRLDEPADLLLENGSRENLSLRKAESGSRLPDDVPLGYHTIELRESGRRLSLIVVPRRSHLPAGLRIWAWAVQLYAARSRQSWGIGDFGDLEQLASAANDQGARLLLVNPLHASAPVVPQQPSPYSPSTRRYLNPLYACLPAIEGARELPDFERLVALGDALNQRPLIERDRIFPLKMRALAALYKRFSDHWDFQAFLASEGSSLREYAAYCVLAEEHGANWRRWPAKYRDPRSPDVRRFSSERADRVRFHQWLQWQLDRQLQRAATPVPVMQDLPIGFDPDGADAWAWQSVLAEDMQVGAPPDEFNTKGQNWGLAPFIPARLRAAGYRPFIETIRGTMRHAGGLRIDHVMGLFRLFWIPKGASPAEGAYVRNAADDLLGIVALESVRAQAIIVGEDLGTVDEAARQQLMAMGILSYRLLWFEKDDPSRYPEQALAAVTTHDLPTIAGLWSGADLDAQRRLGLNPNEAGTREIRDRLAKATGSSDRMPIAELILRTHKLLARAPSMVVTATLEDAAAIEARPNMPGTIDEWPNWSQPLPQPVEILIASRDAQAIARALSSRKNRRPL